MVFLHQDFSRQAVRNLKGYVMKFFIKQNINLILLFFAIPLFGQDDFSSFMSDENIPVLQWSGEGIINTRYSLDYSNPLDTDIVVYPEINLKLDYIGENSEFHGEIGFSAYSSLVSEQLIEEAYFQFFLNGFNIELGYMKLLWGKGDGSYTFDNLNAVDYTDFINPLYIDHKIAETMIKINIPFGMQGNVEAVYTPVFSSDIYPDTGDWLPTAFNIISTPTNTATFADGQLGIRFSNSIGGFDLGTSYQFSFLRNSFLDTNYSGPVPISWDRIHLFGAETAFVVAAFNIWAEAAYYMTKDFAGNDPLVHNNRVLYLLGFSRDLMIHNLTLNIQVQSELTLGSDKITGTSDIDYESESSYNTYFLTAGLKDSFLNEKITAELNGAYFLKNKDFMLTPEARINLIEDTWLNIKYSFFYGDSNTLFGQFEDNDFFEIKMEYSF